MARKVSTRHSNAPIPVIIGAGLTEQWYFSHLHDILNIQIRIRPRFFGTEDIHQLDKKIAQVVNEGSMAICVFDTDTAAFDNVQRQRISLLKAKYDGKKNVIICDSFPSIEFWFLIHYIDSNRFFSSARAVEQDLRSFIPQYAKKEVFLKNKKWVEDLVADGKLIMAVQRAKTYESSNGSYSNIYKAIETICPHLKR